MTLEADSLRYCPCKPGRCAGLARRGEQCRALAPDPEARPKCGVAPTERHDRLAHSKTPTGGGTSDA